jgi:hypothetical protein
MISTAEERLALERLLLLRSKLKKSKISEILIRLSKANSLQNGKKKLNYCRHHVELKNKSDTSNNTSNWNNVKIIQKISEQRTWKA